MSGNSQNTDLTIAIGAKADEAMRTFDTFERKVAETARKSKSVFGEFNQSIMKGFDDIAKFSIGSFIGNAALDTVKAVGTKIKEVFNESIDAAAAQELSVVKLNNALKLTGSFTETTSREFQKYADQLARTTAYEDDVILNQISIAKSFGATNEQAKQIVQTAADMSFALGKDFNSTVLELSQTLEGSAGRLAKYDDRIKALDESALKAGNAIGIFNSKFSGSAINEIETYSGLTGQLKKSFGELLETFGGFITDNELVRTGIKGITSAINDLNDSIKPDRLAELRDELAKFKDKNFFSFTGTRKGNISRIESEIKSITDKEEADKKKEQAQKILAEDARIADERLALLDKQSKERQKKLTESLDQLTKSLKFAGLSELETLKLKEKEQAKVLKEGYEKKLIDQKEYNKLTIQNTLEVKKKQKELQEKLNKEEREEYEKINKENEKALTKKENENLNKAFAQLKEQEDRKKGIANTISLGGNVLQGASGAVGLLKGGAAAAFGPEIGSALGPIIDALSGGPEQTRALVRSFSEAVPVLIEAIVDSIPALITEIADQFPIVLNKLVEKLPILINGFVAQIPAITDALIKQTPGIAVAFTQGIISGIPQIVQGFATAGYEAFKNMLKNLNPFSSDGGGFLSRVGGFLGFADGGQPFVRKVPQGFSKDNFPVNVSSGELIVDHSTSNMLKNFLSGSGRFAGQSDGMDQVIDAINRPVQVATQLVFRDKVFADIIFELNRRNERLA